MMWATHSISYKPFTLAELFYPEKFSNEHLTNSGTCFFDGCIEKRSLKGKSVGCMGGQELEEFPGRSACILV